MVMATRRWMTYSNNINSVLYCIMHLAERLLFVSQRPPVNRRDDAPCLLAHCISAHVSPTVTSLLVTLWVC